MCDMRRFARVRRGAVGGMMVLTIAGSAYVGFAFAGPAASAQTATTTVVIKFAECGVGIYFCYVPSPATVSAGDTVVWTDQSGFGPHTVTRCDPQVCAGQDGGTGSDSPLDGRVGLDQDFSHTFNGPGTYFYYCRIHGYALMHGTVTVAAADTTTTTTTTTTTASTTTTTASATPVATTPTSGPPDTVTAGGTSAVPTATATASSVESVDPITRTALARTGRDLRLVPLGLIVAGMGVVLVSAERRTRRGSR
jgi:plastocyanin